LDAAQSRLPITEATAREKRRLRAEAAERRTELEHRVGDARAREAAAQSRREQIEQGAASFRAAQAFAAAARSQAEASGDRERAQRERMVEERAAYEASLLEERAGHDRTSDARLTTERIELAARLAAEREGEATLTRECDSAEATISLIRGEISAAQAEVERASRTVAPLPAMATPVAPQPPERSAARIQLEVTIAELREGERNIVAQRTDAERLLATLIENETRAGSSDEPQPRWAEPAFPIFEEAPAAVSESMRDAKPVPSSGEIIARAILGLFARRPPPLA
jgi:chromosome segregation ATPase